MPLSGKLKNQTVLYSEHHPRWIPGETDKADYFGTFLSIYGEEIEGGGDTHILCVISPNA